MIERPLHESQEMGDAHVDGNLPSLHDSVWNSTVDFFPFEDGAL